MSGFRLDHFEQHFDLDYHSEFTSNIYWSWYRPTYQQDTLIETAQINQDMTKLTINIKESWMSHHLHHVDQVASQIILHHQRETSPLSFHSQSLPGSLLLFQLCLPPPRVKFQKTALKPLLQPVQKKLRYSVCWCYLWQRDSPMANGYIQILSIELQPQFNQVVWNLNERWSWDSSNLLTLYMDWRGCGITLAMESITKIFPWLQRRCGSA